MVAADVTFTSSNPAIATASTGGLVCGGVWDASFITCTPTLGQAGVGQVTITAAAGGVSAIATIYVHLKVDRVVVQPPNGCISMGQIVSPNVSVLSTSAPGCSQSSPCDITSTVGPITIGSNDLTIAANSAGISSAYDSSTNSPTYSSGGTITGSAGQTCNLSNFSVGSSSGIDPTFSSVTNSPTYTSGGTISGSAGQNCSLTNFNGVVGAAAIVTLTGPDTIASGTPLTITAEGSGATTPPTTATLGNGTASCSGTANVITELTGSAGLGGSVIGAMATVALTGTNAIASGTHLTVTSSGYGATTPPTTATLSNGTATCSGSANVITSLTANSVFTAQNPGLTTIFAGASGVNSVAVPYTTCPVTSIFVHLTGSDTSTVVFNSTGGMLSLTADVTDSHGVPIQPILSWSSSADGAVTVSTGTTGNNSATITSQAPGTASITASCSYPDCNKGLFAQYPLDVVTAIVPGSNSTTVYAASTNSLTVVPIATSTNTAGTPITLPYLPNSIITDPAGLTLYLGSSAGLMAVNLSNNSVSTFAVNGTIVGISPDGNFMLISDTVANNVYSFSISTQSLGFESAGLTTDAVAYAPDSKLNEWLAGGSLAYGLPVLGQSLLALCAEHGGTCVPYTPSALDIGAPGSLTYITSSTGQETDVRATCNQSEVQVLAANNPTLTKAIPNGTGAVVADTPNIDVISSPATMATNAGCPPTTPSTPTSFNLNAGPFTANQLFMSPDSSHAWIVSNLPQLLGFNLTSSTPVSIPYIGGATAYNGGITLDGTRIYVGASDGTVHAINVALNADTGQIAVGLKDANSNPVNPNLVYVRPH